MDLVNDVSYVFQDGGFGIGVCIVPLSGPIMDLDGDKLSTRTFRWLF